MHCAKPFKVTFPVGLSQPSPQKARTEERLSGLPVMVKTVTLAAVQMKGHKLHIHGEEPCVVLLVGVVGNLVEQAPSL